MARDLLPSENAEFRRRHPDPSLIHPGDRLMVPDDPQSVTVPQNNPQFLRLPWNYAARLRVPQFLPLKFSLIWQEPGPVTGPNPIGTPQGFHGRGGLLILDLQPIVGGGD